MLGMLSICLSVEWKGRATNETLKPISALRQGCDLQSMSTAACAICMLLLLKKTLKKAYGLTVDRIAAFNPGT
jgi:hypothetical protein